VILVAVATVVPLASGQSPADVFSLLRSIAGAAGAESDARVIHHSDEMA